MTKVEKIQDLIDQMVEVLDVAMNDEFGNYYNLESVEEQAVWRTFGQMLNNISVEDVEEEINEELDN